MIPFMIVRFGGMVENVLWLIITINKWKNFANQEIGSRDDVVGDYAKQCMVENVLRLIIR